MASGKIQNPHLPIETYNLSALTINPDVVDTSSSDYGAANIRKQGNVVIINAQFRIKANLTASQNLIAYLPEELKPIAGSQRGWFITGGPSDIVVRYGGVDISNGGCIYINYPVFTSSKYMFCSITYIAATST